MSNDDCHFYHGELTTFSSFLLLQIIDSPLEQQWNVDLYGRVALTILFKMEGKVVKLALDGLAGSVGYASFGGTVGHSLAVSYLENVSLCDSSVKSIK